MIWESPFESTSFHPALVSCPGRGAAFFTLLRRHGTHTWTPALQRTASRCAASGQRGRDIALQRKRRPNRAPFVGRFERPYLAAGLAAALPGGGLASSFLRCSSARFCS